ncbi:MAG TPA: hypothetical protein VN688_05605 [Gemmataceae bacterium]|nr:hypothetical protein [Gemmataceae bacterium]
MPRTDWSFPAWPVVSSAVVAYQPRDDGSAAIEPAYGSTYDLALSDSLAYRYNPRHDDFS